MSKSWHDVLGYLEQRRAISAAVDTKRPFIPVQRWTGPGPNPQQVPKGMPAAHRRTEAHRACQRTPGADTTIKPWQWATMIGQAGPVEIVSYPDPVDDTVFVRMTPGDPTTACYVPTKSVAAFEPDRHEWFYRPKRYYSDDPSVFTFLDKEEITL